MGPAHTLPRDVQPHHKVSGRQGRGSYPHSTKGCTTPSQGELEVREGVLPTLYQGMYNHKVSGRQGRGSKGRTTPSQGEWETREGVLPTLYQGMYNPITR